MLKESVANETLMQKYLNNLTKLILSMSKQNYCFFIKFHRLIKMYYFKSSPLPKHYFK